MLPLWVGIEHWFPRVWPWHVGGALYAQTRLLQCVDLLGTSGLTALVFLLMALVFYVLGFATTATAFIALGAAAELMFWVNLFRRK